MNFNDLLNIVGDEPVFETGLLLSGSVNANYLRRQLSEWVNNSKLWQLRRGLYALAPPYQKTVPHPFLVANRMVPGSVVSLQAALAYHSLIPEYVAATTSITARRSGHWQTPLGHFMYRHIQPALLFGYELTPVNYQQKAFIATPEKALLDMVYLQPAGDKRPYLISLRLQNLDQLNSERLQALAEQSGKPKLLRAAVHIAELIADEAASYERL